jgi:hypothetical protein
VSVLQEEEEEEEEEERGGGKIKIRMSELTSLRSKVLEQRTWSLKAWQQIQTLSSQRLDLQQKLDLFKEERALKEEDERNNVPRQELAQRTDMLRELLWMAVKENKALATSEALSIAAGFRVCTRIRQIPCRYLIPEMHVSSSSYSGRYLADTLYKRTRFTHVRSVLSAQ